MTPSGRALVVTVSAAALLTAAIVWAVYPQAAAMVAPDAGGDGVREVQVRVYAWGMSPGVIRVEPGQRVRFVATTDDVMHGFAINELGVNLALAPGRTSRSAEIDVTLPEGTYPIHWRLSRSC